MSAKATVSKITVNVGKHTLELTPEEARALKKVLSDVLEPTITINRPVIEKIIEREPLRPWVPPYRIWDQDHTFSPPGTIVCQAPSPSDRIEMLLGARGL